MTNESTTDLFFPVVDCPLDLVYGETSHYPVNTHKATVRPDDDNIPIILGIVGSDYKIVHNQEVNDAIQTGTEQVLPGEQFSIKNNISYNGAWSKREFIFPNITEKVGPDELNLRTFWINSYDGTQRVEYGAGAYLVVCSNGMFIGKRETTRRKHTANFDIDDIARNIEKMLKKFYSAMPEYKRWSELPVDHPDIAHELLTKLPQMPERLANNLFQRYLSETLTRGDTIWALYNALTYWASHNEQTEGFGLRNTGADHEAFSMFNREQRVLVWINSDVWKRATK